MPMYVYSIWTSAMQCVWYRVYEMFGSNTCTIDDQLQTGAITYLQIMQDASDIPTVHSTMLYDQCGKFSQHWPALVCYLVIVN